MSNTPNDRYNGTKRRCNSDDESDASSDCIQLTPLEAISPSNAKSPSTSRSPGSKSKYYSPTKKRYVNKRQPFKKRLDMDSLCLVEDNVLKEACAGIDDKSIFLLKVINKYLSNESLKNLLDETSQEIINKCFNAVKPGIVIVCRMYWRKTLWYRYDDVVKISKDHYKKCDTPTVQEMIQYLVQNGILICGGAEWSIDNYGEVIKMDELKKICKDLKIKYINKEKALQSLKNHRPITSFFKKETNSSNKNQAVCNKLRQLCGDFYSLSSSARTALHKLYVLMYLGTDYSWIRENKLELVLINDKAKIEIYPIDKNMELDDACDVFRTQNEFEKYYNALILYEEFLALNSDEEKYNIVLQVYDMYKNISDTDMACYISYPEWLRRYTPPHIYIKILDSGIQTLKRLKHNETALEVLKTIIAQVAFRQHKKAEWYAEQALIYKNLGQHNMAAEVLLFGFLSDLPKDTKDVMRNRAKNIANMKKSDIDKELRAKLLTVASDGHILENSFTAVHIDAQPMENTGKGKIKFYVRSENSTSVMDAEDYCLRHYIQSGRFTDGGHWEGRLVTTIFYLLFWDIIYTKPRGVTGIFLSHFQKHPLDIYTDSFYTNRKTLIVDRLKTIENYTEEELLRVLEDKWNERPQEEVSEIPRAPGAPGGISLAAVRGAGAALGAARVAALCARLAARPGAHARGFPDLTLWHQHNKQIIFVEVKTDSDTPSVKQLQWMDYLNKHGMHAEFCYVGAKTTRQKARAGNE